MRSEDPGKAEAYQNSGEKAGFGLYGVGYPKRE